jgi:hypothetical protein
MPFDLALAPLYRLNGQEQAAWPGLVATLPPRKAARGRDQNRVTVYLLGADNAPLPATKLSQLATRAAAVFYETPGTVTAALRAAAESINKTLYESNIADPGRGQHATGYLALAALRDNQLTLLLSGPVHAYMLGMQGTQHIFDTLSGKGLGLAASAPHYFSQVTLQANARVLLCAKLPPALETALQDASPASLEATRRRFMNLAGEEFNAVMLQVTEGTGKLTVVRPAVEQRVNVPLPSKPAVEAEPPSVAALPEAEAHDLQPSAYAIPAEPMEVALPPEDAPALSASPGLLGALPRVSSGRLARGKRHQIAAAGAALAAPREPSQRTRRAARSITGGMRALRQGADRLGQSLQKFTPRLLPASEQSSWAQSPPALAFIALLVPLIVVTVASVVYFRYGRSVQYEEYIVQAQDAHTQALGLQDAAAQREAWQQELFYLDKAESYNQSGDTRTMRAEAQQSLDHLQGITRLQFQPVLSNGLGAPISRLAASENDVYALDGQRGGILHITLTSSGFQKDSAFNCLPGSYGQYTVGPMVDLLVMPALNSINASVIGIDAAGNLLYCAPGQVAQAIPLPAPDTNWGRVKAMSLDSGNLYVLDAQSHAVWAYVGKDGTFVDRPYFFFGSQIPALDDAIDLAVNGDDLYILHSDGHLSTCSYSRIETVPTRCVDPAPLVNPLPAYRDVDLFSEAHFTQMMFTAAPDSSLLLLDSDSQGVFRFAPRSLELEGQLRPLAGRDNPLPQGAVGAMTLSPNHVLYFSLQDRIYFATDSP